MSLNQTPSAERVHIALFGKRNVGKSSIINAITNQELSIVSPTEGTTTDPVYKSMEILPLGPVVLIDTAGLDDDGVLGAQRIQKSYQVLNKTDIAVLIVDSTRGLSQLDYDLIERFHKKELPFVIVFNKADVCDPPIPYDMKEHCIGVSANSGYHIKELKELIAKMIPPRDSTKRIVGDLIEPCDLVILVIPVDSSAPKGRLILPQQQTIRDILDEHAGCICVQPQELSLLLSRLNIKPRMVITDSQAFDQVARIVPIDIPLTSFSILFARYKGNLSRLVQGAKALDYLQDGDRVLISEGCTHHRQCEDIGTVKLPGWIKNHTSCQLNYEFTNGQQFPEQLSKYKLIIHCGGCMLNEQEMKHRLTQAERYHVPITNYGTAIAYMHGILKRSLSLFPEVLDLLDN